jgi:high affinity Mn2+ porin
MIIWIICVRRFHEFFACSIVLLFANVLLGYAATPDSASTQEPSWFSLHGQQTVIYQYHPAFNAAYTGTNSLLPIAEGATSLTTTLFLDVPLWQGGHLHIHPELAGGTGVSGAVGVAGFLNGETFRIGNPTPTMYIARGYLKQVFTFSPAAEKQSDKAITKFTRSELFTEPSELKQGMKDVEDVQRLTIIAGKFGVADFYDNDSYSHDPRTQFMNWSLMSAGAWDYPADTRGYTWGIAAEYAFPHLDIRALAVLVPVTANGLELDTRVLQGAIGTALEAEYRYTLAQPEQQGIVRALAFLNMANAGTFRNALTLAQMSGGTPNIKDTRRYGASKYGFVVSVEQAFSENIGIFSRLSWNDGATETWAFTQIDQSFSLGAQFDGALWGRKDDVIGIAGVVNGISNDHRAYLAAGGLGFIIGDGALEYAPETIFEAYYRLQVLSWLQLSVDYQFVANPAYNQSRGPVNVFSFRTHLDF